MQSRDRSALTEILPAEERAIEHVVARYQRVAPAVTRFARRLAENEELRVRLGSDTSSSPDEIVVNPATFQAAYARQAPVTPDEVALASALHEVVHLTSTNLDERRPVPSGWLPKDNEPSEDPVELLEALDGAGGPAAEALFFALEDARQEITGMASYPGARSVLTDLYRAALPSAMRELGQLGQFALASFMLVGGHAEREDLEKRSLPAVATALADASPFLDAVVETDDPWDVGTLALQLLAVARLHGLLTKPSTTERPSERKQSAEDEGEAIADAVDQVRLVTQIVRDAEGYENTRNAAEARAGEDGRLGPAEVAGQESTDQILRVSQAPMIYLPSGQGGRLIVTEFPDSFRLLAGDGRSLLKDAAHRWGADQRHVTGNLFPLFAANQRRGLRSGYDAGDLSPHAPLLLAGGLYDRMYERRSLPSRRTYGVSLLVDGSASMLQSRPSRPGGTAKAPWAMAAASLGAWMLAQLCDELQIDFEVAIFNRSFAAKVQDTEWSYSRRWSQTTGGLRRSLGSAGDRLSNTVNHYLIKTFDQRWRSVEDRIAGLFFAAANPQKAREVARRKPREAPPVSLFEKAANVDEFNLSYAAERLTRHGSGVRILVVLADGMTRGSIRDLSEQVDVIEAQGTTVLGIGIGDSSVENSYGRHEIVEDPRQLTTAMVDGVRAALRRSLVQQGLESWWSRPERTRVSA